MIKNEHNDWIENEYQRLKLIQEEIVLINGDKEIKRKDLKNFFDIKEFSLVEETVIPFNVGKEFHNEWNRKDIWSDL